MSHSTPLTLQVHLAGAEPYELGDEIWQQSLPDAIRAEAEIIADYAGSDLLRRPGQAGRVALRERVINEMTAALRQIGDIYTAPDGIVYALTYQVQLDLPARDDTLGCMTSAKPAPVVEEVLRFEDLPLGSSATRGACVRWSDGTESQALTWYADLCGYPHADLCGYPHKSPYAESRVMSRRRPDQPARAREALETSA